MSVLTIRPVPQFSGMKNVYNFPSSTKEVQASPLPGDSVAEIDINVKSFKVSLLLARKSNEYIIFRYSFELFASSKKAR